MSERKLNTPAEKPAKERAREDTGGMAGGSTDRQQSENARASDGPDEQVVEAGGSRNQPAPGGSGNQQPPARGGAERKQEVSPEEELIDPQHYPQSVKPVSEGELPKVGSSKKIAEKWVGTGLVTDDQAAEILEAVRARAESWRDGTAVVLGVITATLVIGGDTYDAIAAGRWFVQLLIAAAAVGALWSLFLVLRAAHGPAFLDTKVRETLEPAADRDMRRAGAAAADLHLAQGLLGAGVVAFLLALMLLWWT